MRGKNIVQLLQMAVHEVVQNGRLPPSPLIKALVSKASPGCDLGLCGLPHGRA